MVERFHQSATASDRDMPVAAPVRHAPPRLRGRIVAAIDLLLFWHERRRQRRDLALLSEELLKDIGLTRLDADKESHKWPWRR